MSIAACVDEAKFLRLAADDPQGFWESIDGVPRPKPPTGSEHNRTAFELGFRLRLQLDPKRYELRVNASFVRWTERNSFTPDVVVLPREQAAPQDGTGALERYAQPLPLAVEIWSCSAGDYDISVKRAAYQARGDAESWRLRPYERTLTRGSARTTARTWNWSMPAASSNWRRSRASPSTSMPCSRRIPGGVYSTRGATSLASSSSVSTSAAST